MGGLSSSRWAPSSRSRPRGVAPSSLFPSSRLDDHPSGAFPGTGTCANGGVGIGGIGGGGYGGDGGDGFDRPLPRQQLSRFLKIVSRIQWKLPFLDHGYKLATDRAAAAGHHHHRTRQEIEASEIHFKIDFYEIYMHLERAIVHLLGVYGIDVHPSPPAGTTTATNGFYRGGGGGGVGSSSSNDSGGGGGGDAIGTKTPLDGAPRERIHARGGGTGGRHRYHVNVLLALDDPGNPLHAVLGRGEARRQLWSAKDLRNRWKHADGGDEEEAAASAARQRRGTAPAPLEHYNLEEMLQTILAALEEAYLLTLRYVQEQEQEQGQGQGQGQGQDAAAAAAQPDARAGRPGAAMTEEQDWGFIADAMDWEAV